MGPFQGGLGQNASKSEVEIRPVSIDDSPFVHLGAGKLFQQKETRSFGEIGEEDDRFGFWVGLVGQDRVVAGGVVTEYAFTERPKRR